MLKRNQKIILSLLNLAILFQVCDGALTYIGVTTLDAGIGAEGNPLIKCLMEIMGPGLGLALIKSMAVVLLILMRRWILYLHSAWVLIPALFLVDTLYSYAIILWIITLTTM